MNLSNIYEKEGMPGLRVLAEKADASAQYLRQCATGWKNKRPSPELAARLVEADSRLDFRALLLPHENSAEEDKAA